MVGKAYVSDRRTGGAVVDGHGQLPGDLKIVKCYKNHKVDCVGSHPIWQQGGGVGMQGATTPQGAIVEVANMMTNQALDATWAPEGANKTSPAKSVRLSGASQTLSFSLAERSALPSKLRYTARSIVLALGLLLAVGLEPLAAQNCVRFTSPEAALEQGISAYRAGFYQLALPALTFAADKKLLVGQYQLARLLSDNQSAFTDHVRSYHLYREIVEEHAAKIDVDDDERAPYVGKSLTALARYVYRGLPEIGLQPNAARAAEFLEEAATFFREPDGQFELAKLYLKGDGVQEDRRKALHWLATLSQDGHVGAQAFFADLLWTGKVVPKDEKRALALITVAVENAPSVERFWIEEIYHRVFCGTALSVRQQADGLVASYRQSFAPRVAQDATDRADFGVALARACSNGETLQVPHRGPEAEPHRRSGLPPPAQSGVLGVRGR